MCRMSGYDSTADELTDTWKYEIGDITDIDSVECSGARNAVIDRKEKSSPAKSPQPESERTCYH